jgi:hypothetical protein
MALFVHIENQNLLWNVITKTQQFSILYNESSPQEMENWFKNVIEHFYNKNSHIQLTNNDLNLLNRDVVGFMVHSLASNYEMKMNQKQMASSQIQPSQLQNTMKPVTQYSRMAQQQPYPPQQQPYPPQQQQSSHLYVENKQEIYNRQFNERQKEYESMNMKPKPPDVNFGDNVKDEAITNMDELIKIHQKQREEEIRKYEPNSTQNIPGSQTSIIKVSNNENIRLLPDVVIDEGSQKIKKTVSWSENGEKQDKLVEDIDLLKSQVLELFKQNSNLQNDISKILFLMTNSDTNTNTINSKENKVDNHI